MNPLPYVRYRPADVLVESTYLTPVAELAARRLRDWVWLNQHAPVAERRTLANIARVPADQWPEVERELRRAGWRRVRGRFAEPGVIATLRAAQTAYRAAVKRATSGAAARWERPMPNACTKHPPGTEASMLSGCKLKDKEIKNDKEGLSLKRSTGGLARKGSARFSDSTGRVATPGQLLKERQFLAEVAEMCDQAPGGDSRRELEQWGGWWRARFREDPDKCRRIVADIRCMIREGRLEGRPGAACYDLWQRLPTKEAL